MKNTRPFFYKATHIIFKNAKKLRKKQTKAEAHLWKILRGRHLENLKFRRQHPINRFIVDFYCHELKLVVEIDGDIHLLTHIKEYDNFREAKLNSFGLNVIRFTNAQVYMEQHVIINAILKVKAGFPSPFIPLPKGEGQGRGLPPNFHSYTLRMTCKFWCIHTLNRCNTIRKIAIVRNHWLGTFGAYI